MNDNVRSADDQAEVDHDTDRYVTSHQALSMVLGDERFEDLHCEYIAVYPQANGDVAWQLRQPREDAVDSGLIKESDLG